jgi:hypothetical protein
VARELRARLAGLVAQADHVVEPLARDRVHMRGLVAADVDPVAVPQHGRRGRVQRPGVRAGACRVHPVPGAVPEQRRGHGRAAAVSRAHEQHAPGTLSRGAAPPRHGGVGDGAGDGAESQPWMQGGGGIGQGVRAAGQVKAVVRVTRVETAAARGDQPARAELAQVVGDEVLRLAERGHQFADPLVAAGKLAQQPPPDRIGEQPQGNRDVSAFRCHDGMVHQRGLMEFRPKRALCGAGARQ